MSIKSAVGIPAADFFVVDMRNVMWEILVDGIQKYGYIDDRSIMSNCTKI